MNIQELLKNKTFKIISGIVVLAIIIIAGVLIYQKNITNSPKNNSEQNNATSTPKNEEIDSAPTVSEFKSKFANYDVSKLVPQTVPAPFSSYRTKFTEFKNKLLSAIEKYEVDKKVENKPEEDYFIEAARYANYLGKKDWAKEILNGYFSYYENSSVIWNNLAVIYEEEGNYLKANTYYQKILSVFTDTELYGLYFNIARNYKLLGDMENAHIYYAKYKARGGFDQEMENYLVKYFPKS